MLGPTASGGLYATRDLLERMDPFMCGGEMIREVFFDRATWKDVPWKFEAGTMNIAQEVALTAAVRAESPDWLLDAPTAERWLDGFTDVVAADAFVLTLNYYGAVGVKPQ